jgi:hypothetical protein
MVLGFGLQKLTVYMIESSNPQMDRRRLGRILCFLASGFLFGFLWPGLAAPQDAPLKVDIDWKNTVGVSRTTPTLQVVVNPPLLRGSSIHDNAWDSLHLLQADFVRFVPWLPYPRLGVAELEPPSSGHTSWDFSRIDPLVTDFFAATEGHTVMLNFSTIPQWMFRTDNPVAYPVDPSEVTWSYEQGKELRDPTGKEVGDYYARLAGWYTQGGFQDENGTFHSSPYHHKIAMWEVLNEPDFEHSFSPEAYSKLYDTIVGSVRAVLPETQFVGMSLAEPSNRPDFFEYFLNHRNHQPGIPLDVISYHFYAVPTAGQSPEVQQYTFFEQADKFLTSVRFIEAIRQRLSPNTKTAINEVGCILPGQGPGGEDAANIPASYWSLCGAMYAYLFSNLSSQGIDILGSSQLVGYPTQFPSVTMVDWKSGKPNARYWVLKLLRDNFAAGDQLVKTSLSSPDVEAQAFLVRDGTRKLLIVNKRNRSFSLQIPGAKGTREAHADLATGANPPASSTLTSDTLLLGPFCVAVLTFPR